METQENQEVFHDLTSQDAKSFSPKIAAFFVGVVVLAILTGYMVSRKQASTSSLGAAINSPSNSTQITKGAIYGSNDLKTFKDSTEGVVQKGGIDGEGQFHLVRPGGDSQNVYMTSSLVDLSLFVDRKVKVYGETQAAKKAGWLMDVGRVEVLQ